MACLGVGFDAGFGFVPLLRGNNWSVNWGTGFFAGEQDLESLSSLAGRGVSGVGSGLGN